MTGKQERTIQSYTPCNWPITLECVYFYEVNENWITGKVYKEVVLDSVKLVHGERKREVLPILQEYQKQALEREIFEEDEEDYADFLCYQKYGV